MALSNVKAMPKASRNFRDKSIQTDNDDSVHLGSLETEQLSGLMKAALKNVSALSFLCIYA